MTLSCKGCLNTPFKCLLVHIVNHICASIITHCILRSAWHFEWHLHILDNGSIEIAFEGYLLLQHMLVHRLKVLCLLYTTGTNTIHGGAILRSFVAKLCYVGGSGQSPLNRTFTQAPLAADNGWRPTGNHCNRCRFKKSCVQQNSLSWINSCCAIGTVCQELAD